MSMGNSWVWWWAQANRGENNAHHLNNESINKAGCNPASSLTRTTTPNKEWCRWTAPSTVSPRQRVQSTSPQPNSLLPILDHSLYSGKHEYEPGIGRKKLQSILRERREEKVNSLTVGAKLLGIESRNYSLLVILLRMWLSTWFAKHMELGLLWQASSIWFVMIGKNKEIAASFSKASPTLTQQLTDLEQAQWKWHVDAKM